MHWAGLPTSSQQHVSTGDAPAGGTHFSPRIAASGLASVLMPVTRPSGTDRKRTAVTCC